MENTVTGQDSERENHDDHGLVEELESLYCHVAQLDQADPSRAEREDPLPLPVCSPLLPAAEPSTSPPPSKPKHREFPPLDNRRHQPPNQDELAKRLNEIADAYEEILLLWSHAPKPPLPAAFGEVFAETVRGETPQEHPQEGETAPVSVYSSDSSFSRHRWSIGGVVAIVAIALPLLLWLPFYHYDTLNVGEKVYPLRVNRLTAHSAYFDGKAWIDSAAPGDAPPPPVHSPPLPAHDVIPAPAIAALPLPADDPAKGDAGPASPRQSEPLRETATLTPPADTHANADKKPAPSVSGKARQNLPSAIRPPAEKARRYSIQIKAFREERDARVFAEDMKKNEPEIRVETALLEGSGVWHRILLGNFTTEGEALSYYTAKNTKERYPGSFIKESPK